MENRPLRRRDAEIWTNSLCVSAPPRDFLPHDVGTFRDESQWHRPPGEIGRWRISRGDAETRRYGPTASASPHLGGRFHLMDVSTLRDGSQWHRPLRDIGRWRFSRWAGVHAHPPRGRVGTQPAATDPLVNREVPYPLRGDLGTGGAQKGLYGHSGTPRTACRTRPFVPPSAVNFKPLISGAFRVGVDRPPMLWEHPRLNLPPMTTSWSPYRR